MAYKGGPGTVKNIWALTYLLWYISAFQMVTFTLYVMLFPWTRKIVHTYFASPATYGLLTSDWFGLEWWVYSLTAWVIPVIWWIGWMNNHWLTRSYKVAWLVMCSIELALWLLTLGVSIWWLWERNEPDFPDDPASSFKACCAPEFYNTVPSCPNYNQPNPECNPGININELGTNWPMVFFFVVIVVMIVIYILYLWISFQILWETNGYIAYGDPDAPLEALRFPASSTGGSTGNGTLQPPSAAPPYQLVPSSDTSTPAATTTTNNSYLVSNAAARNVLKSRK